MGNDESRQRILTPVEETDGAGLLTSRREHVAAPVGPGERACCCPARPAVRIILPATAERDHPVDLLMCAHHYRRSGDALAEQGADVFDPSGALMIRGATA